MICSGNLSRLAEEIALEAKAQVFAIRMDCSDSKSVREAFEGVLSLGFVEVLVYNACEPPVASPPTSFTAVTLHSFERSLAVSAVGAFHCAQHVRTCRLIHHFLSFMRTSWLINRSIN